VVRRVRDVLGAVDGAMRRAGEQVNSHSEGVDLHSEGEDLCLEGSGKCLAPLIVRWRELEQVNSHS
jgi:hypothetical protein